MGNENIEDGINKIRRRNGIVLSYLNLILQIAIQLLYIPLLLNTIGKVEFGLYQLIGSLISYLYTLNTVISAGVTRYYCVYLVEKNQYRQENLLALAQKVYLLLSFLSLFFLLLFCFFVELFYHEVLSGDQIKDTYIMIAILGVNFVLILNNSINVTIISAQQHFTFLKSTQLFSQVAQPIFVILLVFLIPKAVSVTLGMLVANILLILCQKYYVSKCLKIKPVLHEFDKKLLKKIMIFSSAIFLCSIADQVFWKTNQLIIGYYYGPATVAIYAVGAQIYMSYMPLGSLVASVYLPYVTKLLNLNTDFTEISNLFISVGRISAFICFLILFGFAIFGGDFINIWAGKGFEESYWIALIIMIPFTIDLIQNVGLTFLQAANKFYFRGYISFFSAIINILLSIFLTRKLGILGAAISTSIIMFIEYGICMNLYYSMLGLEVYRFWKNILNILCPVSMFSAIYYYLYHIFFYQKGFVGLAIGGICFIILYLITSFYVCFNDAEKRTVIGWYDVIILKLRLKK